MQFLSILFLLNESLNNFARILLELKASDPPLKIAQFEDFRHKEATSAVTLGLLSYITPITPIGVDIFFIFNLLGLCHCSKTFPTGFLYFPILLIALLISSIL